MKRIEISRETTGDSNIKVEVEARKESRRLIVIQQDYCLDFFQIFLDFFLISLDFSVELFACLCEICCISL